MKFKDAVDCVMIFIIANPLVWIICMVIIIYTNVRSNHVDEDASQSVNVDKSELFKTGMLTEEELEDAHKLSSSWHFRLYTQLIKADYDLLDYETFCDYFYWNKSGTVTLYNCIKEDGIELDVDSAEFIRRLADIDGSYSQECIDKAIKEIHKKYGGK